MPSTTPRASVPPFAEQDARAGNGATAQAAGLPAPDLRDLTEELRAHLARVAGHLFDETA